MSYGRDPVAGDVAIVSVHALNTHHVVLRLARIAAASRIPVGIDHHPAARYGADAGIDCRADELGFEAFQRPFVQRHRIWAAAYGRVPG